MIALGHMEVGDMQESYAYQPSAIVAAQQQQLNYDWFNITQFYPSAPLSSASDYKYRGEFSSTVKSPFPLVRVLCGPTAQNLSADATTAEFPVLLGNVKVNLAWASHGHSASIATLNRNFSADVRAQWVNLSRKAFGPISAGLLFEMPWLRGLDTSNTSSRVAVGCTLKAVWYEGSISASSKTSNYAWLAEPNFYPYIPTLLSNNFTPSILDSSWLDTLTPTVLETSDSNSTSSLTTLESIIDAAGISDVLLDYINTPPMILVNNTCVPSWFAAGTTQTHMWNDGTCGKGDKRIFLQAILATVVADGLSWYNSILAFNLTPTISTWTLATFPPSPSYSSLLLGLGNGAAIPPPAGYPTRVHKLHASFSVTGYAYYASSTTDHLATAVLALYILVAVAHLFWVLLLSRCTTNQNWTSSAWATVTDLVALCINSPPTSALRGTSAGIATATTYTRVARLRVSHPAEENEDEQIELLFDDEDDVNGSWIGGKSRDEKDVMNDPSVRTSPEEGLLYRRCKDDMEKKTKRQPKTFPKGPVVSYTWPLSEERAQGLETLRVNKNRIIAGKKYD